MNGDYKETVTAEVRDSLVRFLQLSQHDHEGVFSINFLNISFPNSVWSYMRCLYAGIEHIG